MVASVSGIPGLLPDTYIHYTAPVSKSEATTQFRKRLVLFKV